MLPTVGWNVFSVPAVFFHQWLLLSTSFQLRHPQKQSILKMASIPIHFYQRRTLRYLETNVLDPSFGSSQHAALFVLVTSRFFEIENSVETTLSNGPFVDKHHIVKMAAWSDLYILCSTPHIYVY